MAAALRGSAGFQVGRMIESDCALRLMAALVPVVPSREHVAQVEVVLETLPGWCLIARQPIFFGPCAHSRGLRGLLYAKPS